MPSVTLGKMSSVQVLPLATYPAGTYNLPATALADDVTKIGFQVQRCTTPAPTVWPNLADRISYVLELSYNGGSTWNNWFSGDDGGGITKNKLGVEIGWMDVGPADINPGTNRQLRGSVVFNANIRTSVTATVL